MRGVLVEEEKILKIECVLEHIIYPKYAKEIKSGEYGIFKALVTKRLENTEYDGEIIKLMKEAVAALLMLI